MNKAITSLVLLSGLSSGSLCFAEEPPPADLPPPPPPPKVQSGESLEPEVSIIDRDGKRIEEYSVNGRVYAAKITPKGGPAYYVIDTDGDGLLDTRRNDIQGTPSVPQWVLFSW
jgi:hypothetical protein